LHRGSRKAINNQGTDQRTMRIPKKKRRHDECLRVKKEINRRSPGDRSARSRASLGGVGREGERGGDGARCRRQQTRGTKPAIPRDRGVETEGLLISGGKKTWLCARDKSPAEGGRGRRNKKRQTREKELIRKLKHTAQGTWKQTKLEGHETFHMSWGKGAEGLWTKKGRSQLVQDHVGAGLIPRTERWKTRLENVAIP